MNYSLRELITAAYDIQPFQLIGGAPWLRSERFDITAKASRQAPLPELNLMLRSLLAERFKLKVHHEQRLRLATVLGMNLRQTVVDQTALSGGYNLKLAFAPPTSLGASPDAAPIDPKLPSLFSALEEQLGLRLVRRTGPIEVLVIDSVERPTPD